MAAKRAHEAVQATVASLADQARTAAFEAGRIGEKPDKKALKKKRAAAIQAAEDAELDWLTAESRLQTVRMEYLGTLTHHAPALTSQARAHAENGILELVSALKLARDAETKMTKALSTLGGLPGLVDGNEFRPQMPKAPRTSADDFGDGGSPTVHAHLAMESLTKSIGWARRALDHVTATEEEREQAAKLEAEVEAAADLEDDEDDEDAD